MTLRQFARDERDEFTSLLAALTPEQWERQSLCAKWRVRDVAAHVISYEDLNFAGFLRRLVKARQSGRMTPAAIANRVNDIGVADFSSLTPDGLVSFFSEHRDPKGVTTGRGCAIALLDAVVHQQDIRRPLGLPRDIPAERLVPALNFALAAPPIRGRRRIRGTRVIATDLDWSIGTGPEVRGTGEAILMTMAGRRGVVGELSGPGQELLASRLN